MAKQRKNAPGFEAVSYTHLDVYKRQRVDNAIKDGSMGENAVLNTAFSQAASSRLHLLGLVSDGGVHSHINHLICLLYTSRCV